jgi:CRP-like cAMP-binding protein
MRCPPPATNAAEDRAIRRTRLQEWRDVLGLNRPQRYPRKYRLFNQGQLANDVFLIETGFVKLIFESAEGDERVLRVRMPGELAELPDLAGDSVHLFSAVTLAECYICRIDATAMRRELRKKPELTALLLATYQQEILKDLETLIGLHCSTPEDRLARLLESFDAVLSSGLADSRDCRCPLSGPDLASLVGITPRHLRRIQARLSARKRPCANNLALSAHGRTA